MDNVDVRPYLKRGDISRIAKELGTSNFTVYAELSGLRVTLKSAEIRKSAADIIADHRSREKEANQALKKALE